MKLDLNPQLFVQSICLYQVVGANFLATTLKCMFMWSKLVYTQMHAAKRVAIISMKICDPTPANEVLCGNIDFEL